MELPGLGKRCDDSTCKQLDFLPLRCKCNKSFCDAHYREHILTCPEVQITKEVQAKKIDEVYKCSQPECRETSIVPLICERCKQHFCVSHRHVVRCTEEDPEERAEAIRKFKSPEQQFNVIKAQIDQAIDASIQESKKKNKNTKMVNNLQLMRLKQKSVGLKTISITDRVYFAIINPEESSKVTPVFVAKNWSVGRAIDSIADLCKIKNNNNLSGGLKLRFFKYESGDIISKSTSDVIDKLIRDNLLANGENLSYGYVAEDCSNLIFNRKS